MARGTVLREIFEVGPLRLNLELNQEGLLLRVVLLGPPPFLLHAEDLKRAVSHLASMPSPPPKSLSESRFRDALSRIPPGCTRTYGELARELGTAPRAVASRCAANPLLLRTPCHRVVAKNDIGGFQYGTNWKAVLLRAENPLQPLCTGSP